MGFSNPDLIYLDPHYVQDSISSFDVNHMRYDTHINQFHCKNIKKINIKNMCTSIAVGFYLGNMESF